MRVYERGTQPSRSPDDEVALTHGELSLAVSEYLEKHRGVLVPPTTYISITVEQYSTSVRLWHKEAT